MSWSAPSGHIYAVAEIVSASTLNAYVEANLAFLGGPYYARAYCTAAQTIPFAVNTTIHFDTIDFDPNSNFNTSTYTYTVPVAGRYICCVSVGVANMTGKLDPQLYVNGSLKIGSGDYYGSGSGPVGPIPTILKAERLGHNHGRSVAEWYRHRSRGRCRCPEVLLDLLHRPAVRSAEQP